MSIVRSAVMVSATAPTPSSAEGYQSGMSRTLSGGTTHT